MFTRQKYQSPVFPRRLPSGIPKIHLTHTLGSDTLVELDLPRNRPSFRGCISRLRDMGLLTIPQPEPEPPRKTQSFRKPSLNGFISRRLDKSSLDRDVGHSALKIQQFTEPEPPMKTQPLRKPSLNGFINRRPDKTSLDQDVGHSALTIQQFIEHVRSKGKQGLAEEYNAIPQRPLNGSYNIAEMHQYAAKNRYLPSNVPCFNHSRVLLTEINHDPTTDYIHANYVDGYKQQNAFISTQGPLPETTADFWRMVWEQQCLVIVMLTKVIEMGTIKCHQYWERDVGGTVNHGGIEVRTKNVFVTPDFTVTLLEIIHPGVKECREICHFQFTSWPDFGIPASAKALLGFIELVRNIQEKMVTRLSDKWSGHPRGPPMVVHCSAGLGRTGTFCAIDISILRLKDTGTIDVRGTVEQIRSQRASSLQTPDQYRMCHLALIEHALATNLIPPFDLSQLGIADDD